MSLAAGTRLGPYEVIGPIGAGGMGEVYKARDTRLDRDVAIKVLPASVSADPDRRARFEREAKAVAALSHPNILAIHDIGVHEDHLFAVMELLEGETLRDALRTGALPVRKSGEIAIQIARGLAAAHDRGLLHRDLKPENLFLLADGQVKILDFGLARQASGPGSGATETVAAMTDPGTVMGTVGYMAPEQVRGLATDARADLFAFGAVLYEMVSGQRAFRGDTAADTMTAILKEDPPELTGTRAEISPALDRIIRHCLEKNPAERFQTARDIAFALSALSGSGTSMSRTPVDGTAISAPSLPAATPSRSRRGLFTAGLVAAAVVTAVAVDRALIPAAPVPMRFTQKTFATQAILNARVMPDGQSIVYSGARSGNVPQLFEIRAGVLEPRPFGPPRAHLLSVSSKGQLAILTDASFIGQRLYFGTLAQMSIEGSPREVLAGVREADWGPDGTSMAIIHSVQSLDKLEYPIGKVLYSGTGYLSDPRVSPDGSRVAFMDHQQRFDDRGWVRVVDASGTVTTLAGEFWGMEGLAWLDETTVLFGANDRTNADEKTVGDMSYQIRSARIDRPGTSEPALTGPGDFTIYDVTRDGRWLVTRDDLRQGVGARLAGDATERDLSWLNQNWAVSLSSDGSRLLFSDGNAGANYGVVWRKTDGSPIARLGEGNARELSPDGRWALAQVFTPPQFVVYPMGAGDVIHLKAGALDRVSDAQWFPDSKSVVVFGHEKDKPERAYRQILPDGLPVPFLPEGIYPVGITRDGQFVLGVDTKDTWQWHPVDGSAPRPIPSPGFGVLAGWAKDGRSPLLQTTANLPARIDVLDFVTGKVTPFKTVTMSDATGLMSLTVRSLSANGEQYAFSFSRRLSTLFVVTRTK